MFDRARPFRIAGAPTEGDPLPQVIPDGRAPVAVRAAGPQRDVARLSLVKWTRRRPIDGVWWPRSTDLTVEIVPLVTALTETFDGDVLHVLYDRSTWLPAPRRLPYGGGSIKGGWLAMSDRRQITLVMRDGARVVLGVIPASCSREQAARARRKALTPDAGLSGSERPSQDAPTPLLDRAHRWFGTGGPAAHPVRG